MTTIQMGSIFIGAMISKNQLKKGKHRNHNPQLRRSS